MTVAEQKMHAAALVGKLAAEDRAEALAILAHMEWLVENWVFQPTEAKTATICLLRPVEAR